jgi:hypothetical protein
MGPRLLEPLTRLADDRSSEGSGRRRAMVDMI